MIAPQLFLALEQIRTAIFFLLLLLFGELIDLNQRLITHVRLYRKHSLAHDVFFVFFLQSLKLFAHHIF